MYQVLLLKFRRHLCKGFMIDCQHRDFPIMYIFQSKQFTVFLRSDLERVKSQPTLLDFDGMMKHEFTG